MSNMYQEYSASATKARPCYSNLNAYGAYGIYGIHSKRRAIIPPAPVSSQSCLFNNLKPHTIPMSNKKPISKNKCGPYKNFGNYCVK